MRGGAGITGAAGVRVGDRIVNGELIPANSLTSGADFALVTIAQLHRVSELFHTAPTGVS